MLDKLAVYQHVERVFSTGVFSGTTIDYISARSTIDPVPAGFAEDPVVTASAINHVTPRTPVKLVARGSAHDIITPRVTSDKGRLCGITPLDDIVSRSAAEFISAQDWITAGIATDCVVASLPVDDAWPIAPDYVTAIGPYDLALPAAVGIRYTIDRTPRRRHIAEGLR